MLFYFTDNSEAMVAKLHELNYNPDMIAVSSDGSLIHHSQNLQEELVKLIIQFFNSPLFLFVFSGLKKRITVQYSDKFPSLFQYFVSRQVKTVEG